ncbi:MAG: hypothetical protein K0S86_2450 [Geminicoccaceae bacterium]|nr:hypothetical protein [Geminicoccaceae bacterium]
MRTLFVAILASTISALSARTLRAQSGMDHSRHHAPAMSAGAAAPAGQDAFATIAAVVAQLEADSTTDWTKVDIAALRRHLQAMNDVTLYATAKQTDIAGGARMDVTGDGRVAESIRQMLRAHAPELDALRIYRATVEDIPGGVRLTVRAADPNDARTVTKIRALGLAGLLTQGAHHAEHHVMIAKGMHTHR